MEPGVSWGVGSSQNLPKEYPKADLDLPRVPEPGLHSEEPCRMEAYAYECVLRSAESSLFIIIATREAMLYRQFCEPSFSFLS